MERATVTTDVDVQTVRLPKGYHLPTPEVQVRHDGDAIVLEPLKPQGWLPGGFFEKIHIADPSFVRLGVRSRFSFLAGDPVGVLEGTTVNGR